MKHTRSAFDKVISWLGVSLAVLSACQPTSLITSTSLPSETPPPTVILTASASAPTATPAETITTAPSAPASTLATLSTETPTPEFPTSLPNDGIWLVPSIPSKSIQFNYDTNKWTKIYFKPEGVTWSPYEGPALLHKAVKECYIKGNWGTDAMRDYQQRESSVQLGNHQYAKREWFDANDNQVPFAVYDIDIAIEFPYEAERCVSDIEEVLSTYTLIDNP